MYQPTPGAGSWHPSSSSHYRPPPTTSLFPGPRANTPPNTNAEIPKQASGLSPRKSPGRSFSLSLKSKGKLPIRTGLHDRRWDLDFGGHSSTSSAAMDAGAGTASGSREERSRQTRPDTAPTSSSADSLRRTMSSEGSRSARSSLSRYTPPPHPPPKDPIPQRPPESEAALLQNVRMKMSSQDQEAMRKIRMTMDMSVSESGSSNNSLKSPVYPDSGPGSASSHSHGHGRPTIGSRRSTLSNQITSEDLDDPLPVVSIHDARTISEDASVEPPSDTDLTIAVIGHRNVGKSTMIKRATKAWGVSDVAITTTDQGFIISSSYSEVTPGGKIRNPWRVEFLEMDIKMLQSGQEESLWSAIVAEVHGTIICYDAQNKTSLQGLEIATRRMVEDGKPAVLFACKSDGAIVVEPSIADKLGQPHNVGLIEVTETTSDGKSKMRNGLRWLLYKLEQRHRREQRRLLALDLQAEQMKHMGLTSPDSDASSGGHRLMYGRTLGMTPAEDGGDQCDKRSSTSSTHAPWIDKNPLRPIPVLRHERTDQQTRPQKNADSEGEPVLYMSLQQLLDRLFGAIISTDDRSFIKAFFMTFRRFCTPAEVMREFWIRCQEVERPGIPKDVKMWALQKIGGTIIEWLQDYPGDLCEPETIPIFQSIIKSVEGYMFMAHLVVELTMFEEALPIYVDLDTSWSVKPISAADTLTERQSTILPPGELKLDEGVMYDLDANLSHSENGCSPVKARQYPHGSTASLLMNEGASVMMGRNFSGSDSKLASTTTMSDKKSVSSTSISDGPTQWATAVQWIMNNEPLHFAVELTRIQWELFMSIRPRDVFRHDMGKEPDTPIGQSIAFFNRVSRWVTTMILAPPKAKHRARMYERFTLIAHSLRRIHNYESLYAVTSGMQETSIGRLSQTHHLVQLGPGIEKDWQSHLKLMDPRGGYTHYRRALQADLSHDRAAIPLMTTILGLVSRLQTVRRDDFRESDGNIQWDKFVRFYEILKTITDCQDKSAIVSGQVSDVFKRLIEDTPIITDEDALYERSRMLEPPNHAHRGLRDGSGTGRVMRKLANLGL